MLFQSLQLLSCTICPSGERQVMENPLVCLVQAFSYLGEGCWRVMETQSLFSGLHYPWNLGSSFKTASRAQDYIPLACWLCALGSMCHPQKPGGRVGLHGMGSLHGCGRAPLVSSLIEHCSSHPAWVPCFKWFWEEIIHVLAPTGYKNCFILDSLYFIEVCFILVS